MRYGLQGNIDGLMRLESHELLGGGTDVFPITKSSGYLFRPLVIRLAVVIRLEREKGAFYWKLKKLQCPPLIRQNAFYKNSTIGLLIAV